MSLSLLPEPKQSYEDSNGRPLNGGQLFTYAAGTTTPKATYQDAAGMIPNTNPIVLNERGEAVVYGSGNYRMILKNALGATIWDRDNVASGVSGTDLSGDTGASLIGWDGTTLDQILKSRLTRVVDTISQLRALDKTKYTRAVIFGYNAVGDGGYQVFWFDPADTTSADNNVTIIVGADNARWKSVNVKELIPQQAGAKNDGTTDASVALRRVQVALPMYATWRIPASPGLVYPVSSDGGGQCLDFSRPMNIVADGDYGAIRPVDGTTVNNILLKPDPNFADNCTKWEGISLGNPSDGTRKGLSGIFVDTQVAGSNLRKKLFSRLSIMPSSTANAAGFLHINSTPNNVNGGMYSSAIENSSIGGGINLQASGDSNTIHKNIISGPNTGIYASLTLGASLLTMVDNNITNTNGQFRIDAGSRFKILRNNCEQTVPFTGSQQYACDIAGSNGTMSTGAIRDNLLSIFSGITNSGVVRIANAIATDVRDNVILNSNAGGVGIVVASDAVNTRIGPNTFGSSIVTQVSDSGVGTMGVIKVINTFANNWQNSAVAPTATGRFMKDGHGVVHLAGKLALGTTTSGTLMFTLPAGFRPDQPCAFPIMTYAGATLTMGEMRIDTGGNVTFISGQNTSVSLDGISFMAANLAHSISDL